MNTPLDHEPEDLRYAEYVLGVLDADARAAIKREIGTDAKAAAEVARWQRDLSPLAEDVAPAPAPEHVWTRVQAAMGESSRRSPFRSEQHGPWNSAALWRWLALGAGAVAVACILALVFLPRVPVTPVPAKAVAYMTSTLTQTDGRVGWTATIDLAHRRIVIVPASPQPVPAAHAPELWLIPQGQKPIAVGVFAPDAPTTITLAPGVMTRLGPAAALAVSIEPPGGSPTGQPTGPVIAKGSVSRI